MDRGLKKLHLVIILLILIIALGTVYHNGMRSHCPFCISGTSSLDKMAGDTSNLIKDNRAYSRLFNDIKGVVTRNIEQDFTSRAPPV